MAIATVKNPNEIECTLQFTMKLKEWKQISKALGANTTYAELQVLEEIRNLVTKLEQAFYSDVG